MSEPIEEATRAVWRRRAQRLARPETGASAPPEASARYLAVRVGTERFGIPAARIEEVLPVSEATPVPESPAHLWGLISIRGEIHPAFDAGALLGTAGVSTPAGPWHVVLLRGGGGAPPAALRVDRAERIVHLPPSGAAEPRSPGSESGFVGEIVVLDDGTSLNMLRVEALLAALRGEPPLMSPDTRKDVS